MSDHPYRTPSPRDATCSIPTSACLTQTEANAVLAMKVLLGREKAAERLGITADTLDHVSRRGPSRVEVIERVRERMAEVAK